MESIHISQFYSCSEISVSSELFYVAELGKYLYHKFSKTLSLDGVILDLVLKKSPSWDFFRLAVRSGWVVDTNLPDYELKISIVNPIDYSRFDFKNPLFTLDSCSYDSTDNARRNESAEYDYTNPKLTQVCFTEMSNDAWFWTIKGRDSSEELVNAISLNSSGASKAWLSFVAMVAVNRLMTGVPKVLGIEFSYVVAKNQLALSDFLVLSDDTDAMTGWVLFSFDSGVSATMERQLSYEAWYYKGRELGFLSSWYKPKDKLNHLKVDLNVDVGDVVLFYERNYSTKQNYIKSISGCHVAIIRGIDASTITLEVINTVKTKYGAEVTYQNQTMAVKAMYCGTTSYKDFNSNIKTYSISDVGIEYMMHTEPYFILPLDQADDIVELDVEDGRGRHGKFALHQNDVIYWILKDYNIDFNEDKFLSTYFSNGKTAYEVYMSGHDLPDEWKIER